MKLDFGVLVGESTTYPMRTFDAYAGVVLTVNLRMRAFLVHFKMRMFKPIHDPSEPEFGKFRVKIPFHQLGRIWESTDTSTKNLSFLIILDTPAVYHRQVKDVNDTFAGSETIWREGDTWQRQTSMAHRQVTTNAPISLRRSGQIVDLGETSFNP